MRVLGVDILNKLKTNHSDARKQLDVWLQEAKDANWKKFADISARYNSVDFISPDNVIFNIKGNSYRLWVHINYDLQLIVIEKAGTHEEYNHWNIK